MGPAHAQEQATTAISAFVQDLADRGFAASTRRLRRHFLNEALRHAQHDAGSGLLTAAGLMRPERAAAWLADTGLGVPELAGLKTGALHLSGAGPHVDLGDQACPLDPATVHILSRWLSARAVIIAGLEGSDPGYLWIPTKPGRARDGRLPP